MGRSYALIAFQHFFQSDHPGKGHPKDLTLIGPISPLHAEGRERRERWRNITAPTGNTVRMNILQNTIVTIGQTVIERTTSSYLSWTTAFITPKY